MNGSGAKVLVGAAVGAAIGILLGALGGVTGAIVGLLLGAVVGGAIGAVVARSGPSTAGVGTRRATRIDPFTVSEPWRRQTQEALDARRQFRTAVDRTSPGPVQDRLRSIGESIDEAVDEVWATARAGHDLAVAYSQIDARRARRELDAHAADAAETTSSLEAVVATSERMYTTIESAQGQLRLLNARLDESVARGVELSVGSHRPEDFGQLEATMTTISDELEALRSALNDVSSTAAPAAPRPVDQRGTPRAQGQ